MHSCLQCICKNQVVAGVSVAHSTLVKFRYVEPECSWDRVLLGSVPCWMSSMCLQMLAAMDAAHWSYP